MSDRYETDMQLIVHDNQSGHSVKIKPDGDGLGLLEVDGGDDYGRLIVDPEMARHIADAMLKVARRMMQEPGA